jgi:hypothetical protein
MAAPRRWTSAEVAAMRGRYRDGLSVKAIAAAEGCRRYETLRFAIIGRTYRDVPGAVSFREMRRGEQAKRTKEARR